MAKIVFTALLLCVLFGIAGSVWYAHGSYVAARSLSSSAPPPPSACGASCSLFAEPEAGIAPFMSLVRNASTSIDLVIYELEDPAVFAALADARAQGVSVRVILNHDFYSGGSGFSTGNPNEMAYVALARAGVAVRWSSDRFIYTHEKSMVADHAQALIMSFNLVPRYYPTGRDFGVLDDDTADVSAMEAAFDADWNAADGSDGGGEDALAAGTGDDLVWSPGSRGAIVSLIDGATRSLEIYNEEMADDEVIAALGRAAERGVAVHIIMTYSADWKRAWDALEAKGAEVRTFPDISSGLYIHAKAITADDARVFIGSENFSATSLDQNRELGIVLEDRSAVNVFRTVFEKDWTAAEPFRGG